MLNQQVAMCPEERIARLKEAHALAKQIENLSWQAHCQYLDQAYPCLKHDIDFYSPRTHQTKHYRDYVKYGKMAKAIWRIIATEKACYYPERTKEAKEGRVWDAIPDCEPPGRAFLSDLYPWTLQGIAVNANVDYQFARKAVRDFEKAGMVKFLSFDNVLGNPMCHFKIMPEIPVGLI